MPKPSSLIFKFWFEKKKWLWARQVTWTDSRNGLQRSWFTFSFVSMTQSNPSLQLLCCSNRLDSQSLHQLLCKKSIALCGTLVQLNSNRRNKYTLFDGLTSNTYGGEAKCLLVFKVKPLNEGFISLFLFYFLVFCLLVFEILPTTLYRPTLLHGGHIDWIKYASKTKSTEAKPL